MHLVGYLYEDYHDARSLEHKIVEEARKINQENVIRLINFVSGIQFPKKWTGSIGS
jgi:hypothetical protein